MAHPEPTYDLMLMLDVEGTEEQHAKVLADAERIITSGEGTLIGTHDWGVRELAYEIAHQDSAEYHLMQFHGGAPVIAELDRTLSIADGLLRHRIIRLAPGTPPPPAPGAPADAASGEYEPSL
jgi:small subunit ribosomal protein S6